MQSGKRERPPSIDSEREGTKITSCRRINNSDIIFSTFTNKIQCTWLIDTGSAISLIKNSFILKSKTYHTKISNEFVATDVSGNQIKFIGQAVLSVNIGHKSFKITCYIVQDSAVHFPTDGLVGLDFLEENLAIVNLETQTLSLQGVRISLQGEPGTAERDFPVHKIDKQNPDRSIAGSISIARVEQQPVDIFLAEDVVIPAYSCTVCNCIIRGKISPGNYVLEGISVDREILTACVIFAVPERSTEPNGFKGVRTCLLNTADAPVGCRKFTKIGTVIECELTSGFRAMDVEQLARRRNLQVRTLNFPKSNEFFDKFNLKHTNELESDEIKKLLWKYKEIFYDGKTSLPATSSVQHRIVTGNNAPIAKPPYRVPFARYRVFKEHLDKMLEEGIIQPSTSPWSAPAILLEKLLPSGETKYRFCIDYRALNKVTKRDSYPIPNINELLYQLGGAKRFTSLDMTKGFWQVELHPEDREKSAFSVPWGHYECNRMPFGLANSPSTWMRLMQGTLSDEIGSHCFVYLDDIIVFSNNEIKSHCQKLDKIFAKLKEAKLTLNPDKCNFFLSEIKYLGHVVSDKGIKPDPEKLKALKSFAPPSNVTEVRSFLGLTSFYRKFIKNFAEIAKPLNKLTQKYSRFVWTVEANEAFETFKALLCKEPILKLPNFNKQFIIATDASAHSVGAVLSQDFEGNELPIAYASRQLKNAEKNYSTTERECLALIFGLKQFRCYVYGNRFTVITDHQPLKWLMGVKDPHNRLLRWSLLLAEYDFEIVYRPGKSNGNADALSRIRPVRLIQIKETEPIIDRAYIKLHQLKDKFVQKIKKKLNTCPDNAYYLDVDQILFERNAAGDKLVIPKDIAYEIVKIFHDVPMCGHVGIDKTIARLKSRVFWPTLAADVKRYVNACVSCNQRKTPPNHRPARLVKVERETKPFHTVSLDIVGSLVTTINQNKYILVIQDHFTRYIEAFPLPNQKAETVAKAFVTGIILRHGTPRQILTDLGTNFISKTFEEMCKFLQIKHLKTTAYHPQSNASNERSHRTLKDILSHYIEPNQTDWDEWLPFAVSAIVTMENATTGESPFSLIFGRDIEHPYDEIFKPLHRRFDVDENYIAEFTQRLKLMHQRAKQKHDKEIDRIINNFNKKSSVPNFKVSDCVYLYDPASKPGLSDSLRKKWTGPYRITEMSSVNAVIKEIIGNRELKVHVNRLKHCREVLTLQKDNSQNSLATETNNPVTYGPIPVHPPNSLPTNSVMQTPQTVDTSLTIADHSHSTLHAEAPIPERINAQNREGYSTRSKGGVEDHPWVLRKRI